MRTIAGTLEDALSRLLDEPIKVTSAGRTDSGVHATGQVVSLTTASAFAFERVSTALNALLPGDCAVRESAIVADGFSARFGARERRYVYAILNRPNRSALLASYAWHVASPLDLDAMREGAACLVGEHDFRSFCSALPAGTGGEPGSTVRNLLRLTVARQGQLIRIEAAANGFLHRMVRALVGTLVGCGQGRRSAAAVASILAVTDRRAAGPAAPPEGLYLAGVRYEDGFDSFAEPPILAGEPEGRDSRAVLDAGRPFP